MSREVAIKSAGAMQYLDYTDFMGVCCGMVIKNGILNKAQAPAFIAKNIFGDSDYAQPIALNQKHTNVIITPESSVMQPADGIYTTSNKYILIVRTADCFPITLYDGDYIAIIHSGWRSLFLGILKEFFSEVPDFDISQAKAIISPGIRECCFEVSSEVLLLFDKKYRMEKDDKCFVDLRSLILDELNSFGIKSILDDSECTSCNNDMYNSYRREGKKVKQMFSYIYKGEPK